ncbi:MAG: hypothetical protein ACK5XN_36410 [Bacteroidota bacterium]
MGKAEIEQPTFTGDLLSDLVDGWAKYTTKRLETSLLNSKMPGNPTSGRASKSLYQSLAAVPVVKRGDIVIGRIQAAEHYQWVDGDRKKTRKDGDGQVVRALSGPTGWISQKGISVDDQPGKTRAEKNLNLAKAIARKIHTRGYKGNKFFSKIINDDTFNEFSEYLGRAMGQKIAISFETMITEQKKK